jgi:hypothetical protein
MSVALTEYILWRHHKIYINGKYYEFKNVMLHQNIQIGSGLLASGYGDLKAEDKL